MRLSLATGRGKAPRRPRVMPTAGKAGALKSIISDVRRSACLSGRARPRARDATARNGRKVPPRRAKPAARALYTDVAVAVHKVAHNLKKVVSRAGVRLLFTARNKLGIMCRQVNRENKATISCKKHRQPFLKKVL